MLRINVLKTPSCAALAFLAAALFASPAMAQSSKLAGLKRSATLPASVLDQADDLRINRADMAKIDAIVAPETSKLKAAFSKDAKLRKSLEDELSAIGKIKDSAAKKKAIDAFQAKNKKSYELILKQSGVSLSQIASRISAAVPTLKAKANSNLTISLSSSETAPGSPPASAPSTSTSRIRSFTDQKELSCGAIAGSSTAFTTSSIITSGFAAEAGGCTNDAEKLANFDIPADATSARISIKCDLQVEGFAVGIAGEAIATCSASAKRGSVSIYAFAPFLWAGYSEESIRGYQDTVEIDLEDFRSDARSRDFYRRVGTTRVFCVAGGIIAETHGSAKVTGLEVSLSVTR